MPPKTNEWEDDFRKQFDELKLKPPKNSIKNAERELIIWYFRNLLTEKDKEREEAVAEERLRIVKEISFHEPALSAKKPMAYNEGLRSGWYACREFVRLLTPPTNTYLNCCSECKMKMKSDLVHCQNYLCECHKESPANQYETRTKTLQGNRREEGRGGGGFTY